MYFLLYDVILVFYSRKILDDVERLVKTSNPIDESSDSHFQNIVYQLQFKPQQVKLDVASKEADMLHRLDKLENLFGAVPEKMVISKKNNFLKNVFLMFISINQ